MSEAEMPRSQMRTPIDLIGAYGGRWGQRFLLGSALYHTATPVVKWALAKQKGTPYTVVINGSDDVYPELHEWVLERMPEETQKALILSTSRRREPRVRLRFDGRRQHDVKLEGHRILVHVGSDQEIPKGLRDMLDDDWRRMVEQITFTCTSVEARDAVIRMIDGLAAKVYPEDVRPPLVMPSRWAGEWYERMDLRPRALDSVILKDGQLEGLIDDFRLFLDSEDIYERLGQPYHRGYLFHGDPGTGKTSVARALANHFELPIYYLPLSDLKGDINLLQLVSRVEARSVLLIEDVDVYHAATSREDEKDRSSLAAMLNALDGIWTPHGLITVMTTNHREVLDDALVRPGRIDVSEEFTALDRGQAVRLAKFVEYEDDPETFVGQTPATLIEAARDIHLRQRRRYDRVAA